ncbi:uncharacterized protein LOC121597748 isoform X1 [Anopheles merus]|uniref:uncharacterized protein LOC121597748 isoform X1 n=1 Tax=Anopheles merus TaxID=30066 RepID=UPI001BE3DCC9|nr:uncharacterized protein LOC121597748 isoform X1 [Anopheles merus]
MRSLWMAIALQLCSTSVVCIKVTYESFEQTNGEHIMLCNLRVRKFNRTATVLNGTIHLFREARNDVQYKVDMFYSRLGNQQYNHLPMKLPSSGVCDFINNLYTVFEEFTEMFTNFPNKGECPISVRDMHLLDQEFPSNVWPKSMHRPGLWRLDVSGKLNNKPQVEFNIGLKVTND